MTTTLMPAPRQRFYDNNGRPLANGLLYTYAAGTSTPKDAYTDAAGLVPHDNPIRLDAHGEATVYWSGNYKIDLKNEHGVQITGYPVDNFNTDPAGLWSIFTTLLTSAGAALIGFIQAGAGAVLRTVQAKLRESVSVSDYFSDGEPNETAALQRALTAAALLGRGVYIDKPCTIASTVSVPSGSYVWSDSPLNVITGAGTHGIFTLAYPSTGTVFDGLTIDGNKTSGTADVVTLIYAAGSTVTPTNKSKRLVVRNCTLRNGSAGVAFENALECSVHDVHISAMYRHTVGPYAGSYGYGVVYNGCQNSKIHDFTIGTEAAPIQRHGIYLPVFRDADVAPTVLNFASSIQIDNGRISVQYDPANEPFSSCIESWNYFDISITNCQLVGGVRGVNSAPDYMNGSRVQINGCLIKDNEICIRNGRTDKGAAPGTYYFDEYQIGTNTLLPLTSVASHQAVFLQGVKKIIFNDNYARGSGSSSFAFGYYDVTFNNIEAEFIEASNNVIVGFAQGFYLANVRKFTDNSAFELFTGLPLPYVRVANIGSSEMAPKLSPFTSLYAYNTVDFVGVTYYETALGKFITNNGAYWVDAAGARVRGPTANRPTNVSIVGGVPVAASGLFAGLEYGFKYYDEGAGALIYWNGVTWATSQQPAPPLGATTAELNTFKATYPAALTYGAHAWNTTTAKPVWFNALSGNWVYADGTAI